MKILKDWCGILRGQERRREEWLLLHKTGEYQYRNPDSTYVHRWDSFATEEEAIAYLDERIPRADRDEWKLYRMVPS